MAEEQRKHARFNINRPAVLVLPDGRTLRSSAINISRHGLGVLSSQNVAVGTELRVRLMLNGHDISKEIELSGVVRQSHFKGDAIALGLEFKELSDAARAVVDDFINRRGGNDKDFGLKQASA